MHFNFLEDSDKSRPWEWMQMIAQLDDDSRAVVVNGGEGRSRGIIGCALHQSEGYDHERTFAARDLAKAKAKAQGLGKAEQKAAGEAVEMLHQWDFVISREDGSFVLLHPRFSTTKIACKSQFPTFDGELPNTGPGGTSGPGTYKHFIVKNVDHVCRFDAKRKIVQAPLLSQVGGTNRVRDASGAEDCGCWQDTSARSSTTPVSSTLEADGSFQ